MDGDTDASEFMINNAGEILRLLYFLVDFSTMLIDLSHR